jgi:Protein of unknown function (DUF4013)
MEVGKAFTYWYKDPKWTAKLLLGALISIVPILNFAWAGYTNEIIRRVTHDDPEPLPEWGDLGKFFVQGLVLVIAGLIYALPIVLLSLLYIPILVGAGGDSVNSDTATALLGSTGIVLTCCLTLYGLLLSFFLPAVQVNYSRKETFASCFAIGEIIKLVTANVGNYFIAWLSYLAFAIVVSVIVSIVGTVLAIIPCIGWIIAIVIGALASPVIGVVYGHLFGQIGAQHAALEA